MTQSAECKVLYVPYSSKQCLSAIIVWCTASRARIMISCIYTQYRKVYHSIYNNMLFYTKLKEAVSQSI